MCRRCRCRESTNSLEAEAALLVQERHGFHARDIKALAAAQVLARHLVVEQHHVALGFLKTGAVAFIRAGRDAVLLLANHPAQFVRLGRLAERAMQGCRFGGLRFGIKGAFVHSSVPPWGPTSCPPGCPYTRLAAG